MICFLSFPSRLLFLLHGICPTLLPSLPLLPLREVTKAELDLIVKMGIIKPVTHPTPWLSCPNRLAGYASQLTSRSSTSTRPAHTFHCTLPATSCPRSGLVRSSSPHLMHSKATTSFPWRRNPVTSHAPQRHGASYASSVE